MLNTEDAVSQVIGVMLLLAIVIVLAALVGSFAGGAVDTKENAPSADLAVYTAGSGDDFCLVFEHRGGDQLKIADLRINTWVHMPDGSMRQASHEGKNVTGLFGTDSATDQFGNVTWRAGTSADTGNLTGTAAFLGLDPSELSECLKNSTVVEVAVYHLPSGALLHKSSVLLKER